MRDNDEIHLAEVSDFETMSPLLILFWYGVWFLCFFAHGWQGMCSLGCFVLSILVVLYKIRLSVKRDKKTSFTKEIVYGIQMPQDNLFQSVLFWPVELLRIFLARFNLWHCYLSYREAYEHIRFSEIKRRARGIHFETVIQYVKEGQAEIDSAGEMLERDLQALAKDIQTVSTAVGTAAVVTTACMVTHPARGQNVLPDLTFGDTVKLESYGWVWDTVRHTVVKDGDDTTDFDWTMFRLRSKLVTDTHFSAFTELEIAHAENRETNFLRQLIVIYKVDDTWELRAGRLYLVPGFVTPPPFLLETARFPRVPHQGFAYGIQAEGNFNCGLKLMLDLAAQSGHIYDESKNFDGGEFNFRLQKAFNEETLILATTAQVDTDFTVVSSDGIFRPNDWFKLKYTLYERFDYRQDANTFGGYAFLGIYPFKWMELHTQIDVQEPNDGNSSLIFTNGIRLWTTNDQVSLTFDYELTTRNRSENEHTDHALLGRLQIRF